MNKTEIDCLNLAEVKQYYGTLKSLEEKCDFLQRVRAVLDNDPLTCVSQAWFQTHSVRPSAAPRLTSTQLLALNVYTFVGQQAALNEIDLQKVIAAERAQENREEEPAEIEEGADEADTPQRVMVLYYLALAAQDGETVNKSALGRLLCFLTGQNPESIKRYWQNPIGKKDRNGNWTKKSGRDREVVRAFLDEQGMTKAFEWMERDEK